MEQICHREPRPLQQTAPELTGLNEVFVRCCAKSPSQRYAAVDELADDLSELIAMGLSVTAIDGSELKVETPISQYGSTEGRSQRTTLPGSTTNRAAGSTHESQAGTIIDSALLASGTVVNSSQVTPVSASMQGSASTQTTPPNITSLGEQLLRIAFFLIGTVSLGVFGYLQWRGSTSSVVAETETKTKQQEVQQSQQALIIPPLTEMEKQPKTEGSDVAAVTMPVVEPEKPKPLNKLTAADVDGTKEKPRIVAADGSGSHRTIQLALNDSKSGDWIQVSPGLYEESLKLTMPIHLVGGGDVKTCVLTSSEDSPIHIECESDIVSVDGLTIRGTGIQSGKEFNAVNLLKGKLNLANCELKSSTWNCVKVHAGSSLEAINCQFLESNLFSISAKEAALVRIDTCTFFEAGIQTLSGYAEIVKCRFLGTQGISLQQPTKEPSTIDGCNFTNCDNGVIATEGAKGNVRKSEFKNCTFGIRTEDSMVQVEDGTFSGCKSSALAVTGAQAIMNVKGKSSFSDSKQYGCQVQDAKLILNGCQFDGVGMSAIVSNGVSTLIVQDNAFKQCKTSAIHVKEGTLQLQGGSIEECEQFGVYVAEDATKATINDTLFANNLGGAICFVGGTGSVQDIVIDQSPVGVMIRNGTDQAMQLTLRGIEFKGISEMAIDLEGEMTIDVSSLNFGDLPKERQFRSLAGAKVSQGS